MYEHKVVGPIDQVEDYEDAREQVERHLDKKQLKLKFRNEIKKSMQRKR